MTFPFSHIALTVSDLSVSVPWYEALLDAEPVIDEDTDPDMHHTVYLLGNDTLLSRIVAMVADAQRSRAHSRRRHRRRCVRANPRGRHTKPHFHRAHDERRKRLGCIREDR